MATRVDVELAVRSLLESAVDYAGLFPPARLSLPEALRQYASGRARRHAWMLGRFLLPLARLPEFENSAGAMLTESDAAWALGVIAPGDSIRQLDEIQLFNERLTGRVCVEAVEIAPVDQTSIGPAASQLQGGPEVFFEVRLDADVDAHLEAIAGAGACAKIRTGGMTVDAFPDTNALARFIVSCADARVPFKATAGLHHALRGRYPLTHQPDSAWAPMHGFLNLSVAAALIHADEAGLSDVGAVLDESSGDAFRFSADDLRWRDWTVAGSDLAETRRRFFRSFGSCSFEEPVADLEALGVL